VFAGSFKGVCGRGRERVRDLEGAYLCRWS
jgi:hypothetical protein